MVTEYLNLSRGGDLSTNKVPFPNSIGEHCYGDSEPPVVAFIC